MDVRMEMDLTTPGAGVAVTWSPDGAAIAAASNFGGHISVWDGQGHPINQFDVRVQGPVLGGSIAFVDGHSHLVFAPPAGAGDNAAFALWDVADGKVVRTGAGPQPGDAYNLNRAQHFMVSPDQGMLALATTGNAGTPRFSRNVLVYDARSWQVHSAGALPHGVASLCMFGGGRLLGLGSLTTGAVSILDAKSGQLQHEFAAYPVPQGGSVSIGAVAGSPAGDLVMVGLGLVMQGGSARSAADAPQLHAAEILRVKDGSRLASLTAPVAPVRQAMWEPHGRYVAFLDQHQGLFLWAPWRSNVPTRVELPDPSLSLAVSPDGGRIAVTTDRGIRVYSIRLPKEN